MSDIPEFQIGAIVKAGTRKRAQRIAAHALYENILPFDVALATKAAPLVVAYWASSRAARSIFAPSLAPVIEELVRGPLTSGSNTPLQYARFNDLLGQDLGAAYGVLKDTPTPGQGFREIISFADWIDALGLMVFELPEPFDPSFPVAEAALAAASATEEAVVLPDPTDERLRLDATLRVGYDAAFGTRAEVREQHQIGLGVATLLAEVDV